MHVEEKIKHMYFIGVPEFRCISVWHPWADFIRKGIKKIENRDKPLPPSLTDSWFGLHVSRSWGPKQMQIMPNHPLRAPNHILERSLGKVIAVIQLEEVSLAKAKSIDPIYTNFGKENGSEFAHFWHVKYVLPIEEHFEVTGQCGTWSLKDEKHRMILKNALDKFGQWQKYIPSPKRFRCPRCDETRASKAAMENHLESQHGILRKKADPKIGGKSASKSMKKKVQIRNRRKRLLPPIPDSWKAAAAKKKLEKQLSKEEAKPPIQHEVKQPKIVKASAIQNKRFVIRLKRSKIKSDKMNKLKRDRW